MAEHSEIVIAGLLVAIAALVTLARVAGVPYPVFLVIGGGALGLVPGVPEVRLDPDLVLLIFLPPLLYSAAFFASLRDLRANVRPIGLLAVGLVLVTCGAVAVMAHALIADLSWAEAFVLGAIVSPTDPVAAIAVARNAGIPRRVVTIVEGESLINDATALVAYKIAVAAVVTGSFSVLDAGERFLLGALGGAAVGLAVGWCVAWVRERLDDPPVEITISLLTAYLAYLPAEELGFSGVIAAVTIGLYMGSQTSRVTTATVRVQSYPIWQILTFLLNSTLFVLIGLQLPSVVEQLRGGGYGVGELLLWAVLVSATVVAVRVAWIFLVRRGPRRESTLVAWMGMRGAVSLAAALALEPFASRDVILFLVYAAILATLVLQGLTVTPVVRLLGLADEGTEEQREEDTARVETMRAALARVEELAQEEWVRPQSLERLRRTLDYSHRRFAARLDADADDGYERRSALWVRMTRAVIDAQREALERLRREGVISDEVMRRVERDLDLEEERLLS